MTTTAKTVISRSHTMPLTLPEHSSFVIAPVAGCEMVKEANVPSETPTLPPQAGWHHEHLNLND